MNLTPPRDVPMPDGLQTGLLVILGLAAAVSVAVLIRAAQQERSAVPVLVLLGTLLCVVYEPIGDVLVLAYYPEQGQVTWVTLFDRGIPLFIAFMYVTYIGPFVLLFGRLIRQGFTAARWWGLWAGWAAGIILIEMAVLRFGDAWVYYGPQRTVLFDLPVWTVFTYVAFLFTIAAGVHGLTRAVAPRRQWLIIPAVPALLAAAHVTTSLPAAAALYSSDNPTVILLGALGSIAMSALVVHALGAILGVPNAARSAAVIDELPATAEV